MNRKAILNFILSKYEKDEKIDKELLVNIQETIKEIEMARAIFNSVSDPNLVEAAIYREEAARKRFDYLFAKAKEDYLGEKMEI